MPGDALGTRQGHLRGRHGEVEGIGGVGNRGGPCGHGRQGQAEAGLMPNDEWLAGGIGRGRGVGCGEARGAGETLPPMLRRGLVHPIPPLSLIYELTLQRLFQ